MKQNLKNIHPSKVFYGYLYPLFARPFLLGSNYELFADMISQEFILTPEQWEAVLNEWELKELILSDTPVPPKHEQVEKQEGFTKGNWEILRGNGKHFATINTDSMNRICTIDVGDIGNKYSGFPSIEEAEENARLIAAAPELFQMVRDLKDCIKRLAQDNLSQYDRDTEAQWEGEAHELLTRINPNYYRNANE